MPEVVCVCITQCAPGSPSWIAAWTTKPAGLTGYFEPSSTLPLTSMRTRLLAVTSL